MTMTNRELGFMPEVAKKARKKMKRQSFAAKSAHIVHMMEKNTDYWEQIHGHRAFGYRMSQIADMIAYRPSTALMNDLYAMCDAGVLYMETVPLKKGGLSNVEYVFYTPLSWGKVHRVRKELF